MPNLFSEFFGKMFYEDVLNITLIHAVSSISFVFMGLKPRVTSLFGPHKRKCSLIGSVFLSDIYQSKASDLNSGNIKKFFCAEYNQIENCRIIDEVLVNTYQQEQEDHIVDVNRHYGSVDYNQNTLSIRL